ncbi:MAG: hypothetical protein OXG23_07625 [Chloroflexi bacterium]|nr:hypothetical protein [Chloroflexota bacterium]
MPSVWNWLLPEWAQPDHPLLQYELAQTRGKGGRFGLKLQLVLLSLLIGGSALLYAAATRNPQSAANLTGVFWRSMYYPALVLQVITLIMAFALGAAAVGGERSRKTWDHLRVTEFGAGVALRARWAGILYRLRAPILLILLIRLILVGGIVYDLTAFGGLYPAMLGAQATPPLPWRLDLLLIALAVLLNLLLPLAAIAAVAALGILISVAVKERVYAAIIQILVVLAQLIASLAGALAIAQTIARDASGADDWSYALFFGYSAFGDLGLLLAQLGSLGEVWNRVPNGATIIVCLMVILVALGAAADGMMWLAGGLSESRG